MCSAKSMGYASEVFPKTVSHFWSGNKYYRFIYLPLSLIPNSLEKLVHFLQMKSTFPLSNERSFGKSDSPFTKIWDINRQNKFVSAC